METMTFEDFALLLIGAGAIAAIFGGLICWVLFGAEND